MVSNVCIIKPMNVSKDFIFKAIILLFFSVLIYLFTHSPSDNSHQRYPVVHCNYHAPQQESDDDHWIFFMTVLSTLFAVFFVYSGFKIDASREKIDDAEKRINLAEKKINEELLEYTNQLQ